MSTIATVLLVVGGVGFVFLLASVLLGEVFSIGHDATSLIGHDVSHGDTNSSSSDSGYGPSWVSPQIIATALVGFGGFGLLALSFGLPEFVAWIAAAFGFFALSIFMRECVFKPIVRGQHNSLLSRNSYIGAQGVVFMPIPSNGYGEVRFLNQNGAKVFKLATTTGPDLAIGTAICITDVTNKCVVVETDSTANGG